MEDASIKEGLAYEKVAGALERRIEGSINWARITEIRNLGRDEIALKKDTEIMSLGNWTVSEGEIIIFLFSIPRNKSKFASLIQRDHVRVNWFTAMFFCGLAPEIVHIVGLCFFRGGLF